MNARNFIHELMGNHRTRPAELFQVLGNGEALDDNSARGGLAPDEDDDAGDHNEDEAVNPKPEIRSGLACPSGSLGRRGSEFHPHASTSMMELFKHPQELSKRGNSGSPCNRSSMLATSRLRRLKRPHLPMTTLTRTLRRKTMGRGSRPPKKRPTRKLPGD